MRVLMAPCGSTSAAGRLRKTALMEFALQIDARAYDIAAITHDIYTKWDAEFLCARAR